ncbi:uncharacterized protein [Henckelia pumila]|uniref:uncharacterized protein isoform X2 n=1 Tax=Henckelia pumila TaxID=405737 RepID=UPI003C6DEC2C
MERNIAVTVCFEEENARNPTSTALLLVPDFYFSTVASIYMRVKPRLIGHFSSIFYALTRKKKKPILDLSSDPTSYISPRKILFHFTRKLMDHDGTTVNASSSSWADGEFDSAPPPSDPLLLSPPFRFPEFSSVLGVDSPQNEFMGGGSIEESVMLEDGATGEHDYLFESPRPLESLQGISVPPFLSKTFELVDDPSLDAIISWGAKGDSFVVWDHVDFSRLILPRNFKHNNFSSFVRQLNTYGFRKIDTEKWEFTNEGFVRGKRHLLKNIHRRRSPQSSQQIGSSSVSQNNTDQGVLEGEIGLLRRERSLMMMEVVELRQQQKGMVQNLEDVSEKLKGAENRQKQMVAFMAKMFQNPAVLARLKQAKERSSVASPRTMRKFVKHHQQELSTSDPSSPKGQIVKYKSELQDFPNPSVTSGFIDSVSIEQLSHFPFQAEHVPLEMETIVQDESAMINELFLPPDQFGEVPVLESIHDPLLKGKGTFTSWPQSNPDEKFVTFPTDFTKGKSISESSMLGTESSCKQGNAWSMGFEATAGMSSSSAMPWNNPTNFDARAFGFSDEELDSWDIESLQPGVGSLQNEDYLFTQLQNQAREKKMDP